MVAGHTAGGNGLAGTSLMHGTATVPASSRGADEQNTDANPQTARHAATEYDLAAAINVLALSTATTRLLTWAPPSTWKFVVPPRRR